MKKTVFDLNNTKLQCSASLACWRIFIVRKKYPTHPRWTYLCDAESTHFTSATRYLRKNDSKQDLLSFFQSFLLSENFHHCIFLDVRTLLWDAESTHFTFVKIIAKQKDLLSFATLWFLISPMRTTWKHKLYYLRKNHS